MKKYLSIQLVLLFTIMHISAQQFSNENFIYSEAPQKAVQSSNYNSLPKIDIQRSISYFDGLGRLKQTIGIGQGAANNLLDWKSSWTLGSGGVSSFSQNGQTSENIRIDGLNPFGNTDRLWRCVNDAGSDADGGWNTSAIAVDKTKSYIYTVWVKRTGGQNGTTYHGTQNVVNLDGTANGNPYFWAGNLPALDTWYLMVGKIHESAYTGGYSGISGVYDMAGNKVIAGTDFKWSSTTIDTYFRSYLYYATDVNVSQYFYAPTVQKIESGQFSVLGLLKGIETADIVTPAEYDAFGRQTKEYLPYAVSSNGGLIKADALTDVRGYYNTLKYENTINPFSEKLLEASPLNRVLKQAAPGNDWVLGSNHEIKLDYQTNTASEVKLFTVSLSFADNTYTPTLGVSSLNSGYYLGNQIYKTITKDENWVSGKNNTTEEFKDKQGRVILKRTYSDYKDIAGVVLSNETVHDTYYVYDDYGNLTYVLPPKMNATIAIITVINDQLNDLGYQYKYDSRNRLVEKKLPGKQWEFIVYDKLDRVAATGPANSPFSDLTTTGWLITKYDAFSRPVYTGWMATTPATSAGRGILQGNQNTATEWNESKTAAGSLDGISAYYSNTVMPTSFKLLTVNYYDNYTFPSAPAIVIPTSIEGQNALTTTQVKSLPTASWTRVLTTSSSLAGETVATFYDAKARPIRSYTQNYLGGYTYTDIKLDFPGRPEYTITYHKRATGDAVLKTKEAFGYSPQGRLLTHTHQINDAVAVELLASNSYDDLGQLISKKVGNTIGTPLQKVDFTYNIRGWMTEINKTAALSQGADPKDLFAFKINYNTISTGITGVKALYNGNIAEAYWNTADVQRAYGYKYDNLNRLIDASYQKATVNTNAYKESLAYDKNGNIMSLVRNGTSETSTQIDNLVYSYGPSDSTNQLTKVADSSSKILGFIDTASNTSDDYSYDANGNMLTDANKGITTNITYNHLNLPTKIVFPSGNITYLYNASGQKLQKIVTVISPVSTAATDYLGRYQYLGGILQFFPTAEGYVEQITPSSYKYVFQYKDHLGNVRLSYKDSNGDGSIASTEILEENSYYPFGLKHTTTTLPVIVSTNQGLKYKFNDKELQDELGLNIYFFKFRSYDPALGRFWQIDPLAGTYAHNSTYAFAENNVSSGTDLEGLELSFHLNGNLATAQSGPRVTGGVNGNYTLQELKSHVAQKQAQEDRAMNKLMSGDPRNLPSGDIRPAKGDVNSARFDDPGMMMADGARIGAEFMAMDIGAAKALGALGRLGSEAKSVWALGALERGRKIETMLGADASWASNFPTIDKIENGVATSIKSMDLTASSYQKGNSVYNTLKGYVDSVASFGSKSWGGTTITQGESYTSKALELAVQTGKGSESQWNQINKAVQYAWDNNINVTIKFIK